MYKIVSLSKFRTIFAEKLSDTRMFDFILNYSHVFGELSDEDLRATNLYKYLFEERKGLSYDFGCDLGVFNLPWGNFRTDYPNSPLKDIRNSRFCGPSSDRFALEEIKNIIGLYLSMKNKGWRKRHRPLSVVEMVNVSGKSQFVILGGNHRAVIGYALGYKLALVTKHPLCYGRIKYKDVAKWYHVENGDMSEGTAMKIFNSFFK